MSSLRGAVQTIQVSAHDDDEGDTLRYEWYCFPGYGCFLPGGTDWIATDDSFVTYVTPSTPYFPAKLWVFVYDNHEGWAELESNFEVYDYEYSCLCGDADGDGVVSWGDALDILHYFYHGSDPPPDPILRADANNSCELDLGDAIHILNWLFKAGDPSECCWFPPENSP